MNLIFITSTSIHTWEIWTSESDVRKLKPEPARPAQTEMFTILSLHEKFADRHPGLRDELDQGYLLTD